MSNRENFFQAHWDWLVAGVGVAALVGTGLLLAPELSRSAESAGSECERRLSDVRPAHDGVAAADLSDLVRVAQGVRVPPTLPEVDGKKASFLASARRLFCRSGEAGKAGDKACGRPIPAGLETCPFCGVRQTAVAKVDIDSDHDGMPNDWEVKYGLNPTDAADAAADADKDGFSNLEEFQAKTDPKDAKAHPDYLSFVTVDGGLKETFLPFYFKQANPLPGKSWRLTFQRLGVKSKYDSTFSAKVGEEIRSADGKVKSGYVAQHYETKTEEKPVPGSKGLKRRVEVGFVTVERKADGKKLVLRENERRIPVESEVTLVYGRDGGKSFTLRRGATFEIHGVTYAVRALEAKNGKALVTVEDVATKKQSVIGT